MKPDRSQKILQAGEAMSGKVEYTETVHHVGAREKKKQRGPVKIAQLNLTSMMDVIFLLLIFFVLTANFVAAEGVIEANLPTGVSDEQSIKPNQTPVRIVLRRIGVDGVSIWIDKRPMIDDGDFGKLFQDLNGMNRINNSSGMLEPDNPIIIKALTGVRWDHVVNAFNACIRAKYTEVSFAQAG